MGARRRWWHYERGGTVGSLPVVAPVVALVAALVLAQLGTGCAPSLVEGGRLRPEAFDTVVGRTERARGLRFDGPIAAEVVDSATFREIVQAEAEAQWTPEALASYQDGLTAVGLWPAHRELLGEFVAALGEEAGGLYLPDEQTLYIVEDPATPLTVRLASFLTRRDLAREVLLTHELVHTLQHRHYPALIDRVSNLKGQDDVVLALQAALEGDAVRYGFAALETGAPPPAPVDFAASLEKEADRGRLAERPALVRYSMVFPYAQGYRLSSLEASMLLEDPPVSSEQVLHADARHQPFLMFDLSRLANALPEGCSYVYENTIGEFGISVLFRDLASQPQAVDPSVWTGWDGDRYLVAECGGRLELFWLTAWDSEADASEFATAYIGIAEAVRERGELASTPTVTELGSRRVVVATDWLAEPSDRSLAKLRRARVQSLTEVLAFVGSGAVAEREPIDRMRLVAGAGPMFE